MTKHKTALVLGATGLVGKALLAQLKVDNRYSKVICAVRRAPYQHPQNIKDKVFFSKVDFDEIEEHKGIFAVDHVYVCLGTTIKKAGSQQAFRKVDYDYVYDAAYLSAKDDVKSFVWVSSVGADAISSNFYLRVKGELEESIANLDCNMSATCVQPSLLLGEREDSRPAEKVGILLSKLISPFLFGALVKYKPIEATEVARQMIAQQQFD